MADNSWSIRRATAEDREFLTDMLLEAVNWSPEWKPKSRSRVLSDPRTARYIAGWPRDTDLGVIAEAGSQPAGAAWIRYFPADDPAYGFTSPDVPELTIGVAATWRGRGMGRTLLRAIAESAAEAGIGRISLSVERKNFARGLYLSEGYTVVDASDPQSDTMIKNLAHGRPALPTHPHSQANRPNLTLSTWCCGMHRAGALAGPRTWARRGQVRGTARGQAVADRLAEC